MLLKDGYNNYPAVPQQSGQIAAAPKPLTHEDRLNQLESRMQQLNNDLAAVAETHAAQLTALQQKVGG